MTQPLLSGYSYFAIVKVDGAEVASLAPDILEIRVHRSIGAASWAEIVIIDEHFSWVDGTDFAIGKALEIQLKANAAPVTVFSGEITVTGLEQRASLRHLLVVEAYDKSHRMGHATRVKSYLQQSWADVIQTMVGPYSLTSEVDSALSSPVHPYLLQQESDLALLERIALRTGSEWYVDQGKLYVRPRPALSGAAATTTYGQDLIRFRARYSGTEHIGGAEVRGWDPESKQAIVGTDTSQISGPQGASAPSGASTWRSAASGMNPSTARIKASTLVVGSADEATLTAKALARRQSVNELVVHGETMLRPELKIATVLGVAGVGTKFAGDYYLTEVEHRLTRDNQITRFTAGPLEATELVDLVGRGPQAVDRFTRSGLVIGIVTNNNDQEHPGLVKVKFPALGDQDESAWARLVSVGAGTTRGFQVVPEVNDEVLVGFEHGDPRRPFVLGGLWSPTIAPPVAHDQVFDGDKVKQWQIKTRTGHTVTFLDEQATDDASIKLLHADTATMLEMKGASVKLVSNRKPIEISDGSGKGSVAIDGSGNVTIKGETVKIEGTSGVTIESKARLDLKGTTGAKVDGGPNLELMASGAAKLQSSGQLTVKGSITMIN